MIAHAPLVVERLVLVFDEDQQQFDGKAMPCGDAGLDDGESGVGLYLKMLDLAKPFALVKQVDRRHWVALRKPERQA